CARASILPRTEYCSGIYCFVGFDFW
nr:immunoglobulin heavy chain junction region [Macaca mulatta]MOV55473.1 immunoglobulin heavy chain junction region [Macaca mulatta]MOV55515.1 immunoglobulin heavy chain junction region [Macaca mulatta]MOV56439.1 immunoglobulin heavy chain junction region [Macaca mulatta]MOV57226.1 immunoglobulin heavy chain junction region [Macaca mulatta]